MKSNTSKKSNFYTQGQQFIARVLFTVWLLASISPEGALATPKRQMTPATTTSPQGSSLASTPPTPPPGGALQLPSDSPGSLLDGSVASSPSIEAALQSAHGLRARTLDKLVGRFWGPRGQEALRTPAGPVAEGVTEGASSAVVASSVAPPTLQQLITQRGVPENKDLLAALDAAPFPEQERWLKATIEWWASQPIEILPPAVIQDYAALAHVRVNPENRELLKCYFHSLCNKVKDRLFGEELLIQALVYALANIDPAIFAGNPQPLLDLGTNLLAKLNPSQREFKQADYPSARTSLEALFQTLFLAKEVAPGHLNVREGGLYQSFISRLKEIIERAQYYPAIYHARILKQTLQLLEDPEPDLERNLRRVGQGLLGAANLVAVGQGLVTGELKPAELQEGIALLQKAFEGQRIQPEPWYSQLLTLEEAMLRCLKEGDLRAYPEPEELVQRAKDIPAQCRKRERLAAFLGSETINQYKQALCFGIVMQLRTLALQGLNPELRQGSIERLIALGQLSSWGTKTEVMAGLLESLALVATQSQADSDREAEAAMAHEALKGFTAAASAAQWLVGETLSAKLHRLREQTTERTPSDEERLVTHIKGTQRRMVTIKSFRAQEIANIAQLSSYILLAKPTHFVERTAATKQLSAILANKGICVLHGFGGAGKSTLAAHYGHGRKDTQTVRWISAEDSFKLQEGYEQLAQELQVAYQPLAKKLAADASQYRQELARMVYNLLEKSSQPTLLILDNAQDASLVADYLLHRPATIQAIITTRSAKAFVGKYDQLQLGPFSQDEGKGYLEVRFKEMSRVYTPQEGADLLEEVGLIPQKLELAASYLQSYELVTTAQYIARLQALKKKDTKKEGELTLPEVALGLETLTREGQQLMQYAAYLDGNFIPLSFVNVLLDLDKDDPKQLKEIVNDLSRLSLMQVVQNQESQGLEVHREVQASCREYQGWSPDAALGTRETILLQIAKVLAGQVPDVASYPDDRWQQATLYTPHVATVWGSIASM